jgi:hypothetical protein
MNFRVEPEVCLVDQPIEVRVTAVLDRSLEPGDRIAFAPPESWSSQPYRITFTKEPQSVSRSITIPSLPGAAPSG